MTITPARRLAAALMAGIFALPACAADSTDTASAPTTAPDATTTSLEPTIDGPVSTTSTTIAATTTTTTEDPIRDCSVSPSGSHLVNVRPDDPDGGLNLRVEPGTESEIALPLPAGTEVIVSGECVDITPSGEWWGVTVGTDASLTGWVAASFLDEREIVQCPDGVADVKAWGGASLTFADVDGDGTDDRVYVGTDASENAGRMAVELATGGLVEGTLSVDQPGNVAAAFRPIGAARDVLMYRDVFGGGASTSRYVFAELVGCEVNDFGSIEAGASAGWGALGYCLEPTGLGVRLWRWNAVGDTAEEGLANRVDDALHYYDSDFVPGTGELDGRECIDDPQPETYFLAPPFIDTRAVGLTASTLDELIAVTVAALGGDESSTTTPIGEPVGIDALGGFLTLEIIGLTVDSVAGFRAQLDFSISGDGDSRAFRAGTCRTDRVLLTGSDRGRFLHLNRPALS